MTIDPKKPVRPPTVEELESADRKKIRLTKAEADAKREYEKDLILLRTSALLSPPVLEDQPFAPHRLVERIAELEQSLDAARIDRERRLAALEQAGQLSERGQQVLLERLKAERAEQPPPSSTSPSFLARDAARDDRERRRASLESLLAQATPDEFTEMVGAVPSSAWARMTGGSAPELPPASYARAGLRPDLEQAVQVELNTRPRPLPSPVATGSVPPATDRSLARPPSLVPATWRAGAPSRLQEYGITPALREDYYPGSSIPVFPPVTEARPSSRAPTVRSARVEAARPVPATWREYGITPELRDDYYPGSGIPSLAPVTERDLSRPPSFAPAESSRAPTVRSARVEAPEDVADTERTPSMSRPYRDVKLDCTRVMLVDALRATGGNKRQAAIRLGMDHSGFYKALRRTGLPTTGDVTG